MHIRVNLLKIVQQTLCFFSQALKKHHSLLDQRLTLDKVATMLKECKNFI